MKVIKVGAVWCATCLAMKPAWQKVEQQLPWLETEYFDFDQDQEKIKSYRIESDQVPVFVFLDKEGKEIKRLTGEHKPEELVDLCEALKDK